MKVYGIKTCGSVKKALKFFDDNKIKYEFIDLKKVSITKEKLDSWLKKVKIDVLFNNRGKKYRDLKLKDLNLNDEGKKEYLLKEYLLIKRPVIEFKDDVIVAFDEDKYKEIFLK